MSKSISWYAKRYVEKFGFHLVPIEPKRKFPRSKDWGNDCLTTPEAAEKFYQDHPDYNMGCALGGSQMCSLDIDCMESFKIILDEFGIPIEELDKYPTIQGASKGCRVMFRVPDGAQLKYQKLNWPSKLDPDGSIHRQMMADAKAAKDEGDTETEKTIRESAKAYANYTVIEMRSGTDGKQRQDVLPPSIHPDTGEPYKWIKQPAGTAESWPEPPPWLLSIWEAWENFKPQFKDACPWVETEKYQVSSAPTRSAPVAGNKDVIGIYNATVSLEVSLDTFGYKRMGKRWLSPHSGTGLAGVCVFPDGERCWIHHASDPLCSEENGQPVNSFDLFCYYNHGDDVGKAVKAAAKELGIVNEPNLIPHEQPPLPDYDYPEIISDQTTREDGQVICVNYADPLPYCSSKSKPLKHIVNLAAICDRLGVVIRYNVISKEEEIIIPNEAFSMDNKANASFAWLKSECSRFDFSTDALGEFLTYLSDKNLHNPVVTWIDSEPWDGEPRLHLLYATVTAKHEGNDPEAKWLKETLIKRWMISAIVAAFVPNGVSAQGMLVFQGDQDIGKTRWLNSLVPEDLDLVTDGMILKPDDKDSVKQCCSFWLVELGELDSTFRRSDIAALKAFITKKTDILRRAYARKESQYARRTVFFGSVNPKVFLHDSTGNRRYWTIATEAVDHAHGLNMQQIWAEVKTLWESGEVYYLTGKEKDALNDHNEDFLAVDPIHELLLAKLDWDQKQVFWPWSQATEILQSVGLEKPTKADATTAAGFIRKRNGDQHKRSNGKTVLCCPPIKRNLP